MLSKIKNFSKDALSKMRVPFIARTTTAYLDLAHSLSIKSTIFGRRSLSSSSVLYGRMPAPDPDDPEAIAIHKLYRPERVTPTKRGYDILKDPAINKGMAFTLYERQYLGMHGLLPPAFMTEEQQAYRIMIKLRQTKDNLEKYIQLSSLLDRNEKLFFRVLCDNIKELMPIVYTPTVGQACQEFGFIYRNPRGVYITPNDNSISKIHQILCNWPHDDVKAIVVTDGERILGLGDLGAYGMGIPIGKLTLYTALAGIKPSQCLPVLIDVGTDNQKLLNDPFYIGLRHKRIRGKEYDTLLDNFMNACIKKYGQDVLIQFEDFGNQNAYRLLDRYKDNYTVFNDDIQGTAAVVVAGLLGTTRVTKKKLSEQRFVFLGAGGAATGVAEMCVQQMLTEGLSHDEACDRIYLMDIDGLITKNRMNNLGERHIPFAKDLPDTKSLLDVINTVQPNGIIGASTVKGAFTPEIIKRMAEINPNPIIFALSNPTSKAECTAEDAFRLTKGKVLFASGSPFPNLEYNGKIYKPGQGNNAYIFPSIGLAVCLFKIKHIKSKYFLIAARRVAASVTQKNLDEGRIYPRLKEIRDISVKIAVEIAEEAYKDGLATLYPKPKDMELYIRAQVYDVEYDELINKTYVWPEKDCKHGFPVPVMRRDSMDD
uniref:Malic enzyme n=1 Tax=Strongyloides venezuelensis TaxID=75913 RepID=A0A0K0FYD7_STRVS